MSAIPLLLEPLSLPLKRNRMKRDHLIYQLRNRNLNLGLENQGNKTDTNEHTG